MKRLVRYSYSGALSLAVMIHSSLCLASGSSHDMSINWFSGLFTVFATDSDKPPPLIGNIINFVILLWLLYIIIYKPMNSSMKERRTLIENDLNEAANLSTQAGDLYKTSEDRTASLDQAIAQIHKDIFASSEREKERIKEEAKRQAERLMNHAKEEIAQDRRNIIGTLRSEILSKSVKRARDIISARITPQDHFRITKKAIDEIEKRAES